jgi:hypothetical protein
LLLLTGCVGISAVPCAVPMQLEDHPKVRVLREWTSDDGSRVGCRLLVGTEEHVWRKNGQVWERESGR